MTVFKFANFVSTELEEGISAGATEMLIPVAASERLPELEPGDEIRLVLWDGQQEPEIVGVTENPQSGVLTMTRAQEDTTAVSWEAGTQVRCVLTAAVINAALEAFFDIEDVLELSFLQLIGGTLTGPLTLAGAPTSGLHATTKAYVDNLGSNALPTTGGTMAGNINMGSNQIIGLVDPTVASSAVRKIYVDNLISGVQGQIAAGAAVHTTTGTGSAYIISTGGDVAVLSDGMAFIIRPHITNEGDPTLTVDLTSPKPIIIEDGIFEGLLVANVPYTVIYDEDEDVWILANVTNVTALTAPVGTQMLFVQTTPPAGWTKLLSHNNKALRLVTGTASSGGSTAFTSVFGARSITQGNLPSYSLSHSLAAASHVHGHGLSTSGITANHTHGYTRYSSQVDNLQGNGGNDNIWQGSSTQNTGTVSSDHAHNINGSISASGSLGVSGTISSGGSGSTMDFAVQYVDTVIGVKD